MNFAHHLALHIIGLCASLGFVHKQRGRHFTELHGLIQDLAAETFVPPMSTPSRLIATIYFFFFLRFFLLLKDVIAILVLLVLLAFAYHLKIAYVLLLSQHLFKGRKVLLRPLV